MAYPSTVNNLLTAAADSTSTIDPAYDHATNHNAANVDVNALTTLLGVPAQTTPTGANRVFASTSATATAWTGTPALTSVTAGAFIDSATHPATTGVVRLANLSTIQARNAANGADINLIYLDASNHIQIDNGATGSFFGGGVTVASGQTLTLTGVTVAGTPTWSSSQAITVSTAAQPNITSVGTLTGLTTSGAITVGGNNTISGSTASVITLGASNLSVTPPSGGLFRILNNAQTQVNLSVADAGGVTILSPSAGAVSARGGSGATSGQQEGSVALSGVNRNAATNTSVSVLGLEAQSSGTPTTGFGPLMQFASQDDTLVGQPTAAIETIWSNAAHGSRIADLVFQTNITGSSSMAERLRLSASGLGVAAPATMSGAGAGDVVLKNNGYLRGDNVVGNSARQLLGVTTTDNNNGLSQVSIIGDGSSVLMIGAPGTATNAGSADTVMQNGAALRASNAASTNTFSLINSDGSNNVIVAASGSPVKFGSGAFTANGAVATALTSVGPTGSHTTVQEWFTITDSAGTVRYIPAF